MRLYEHLRKYKKIIRNLYFVSKKKWLPFAEYCDSCYLMLDFDPDQEGQEGQIICYIHDPDEIIYVAKNFTELIEGIMEVIV
ncbi:SMI1/KNR4 family protein [Streptococcus parasanguinis]|uniref:SMI1/KNR4 family protein n=1 Tax=Streptococcus parasanguinis TaxID=1318 RepID=UPI0009BA5E4F|nr:SMI1/KNR4 family protein [Streptococcus parasanguinis]MDB8626645.1 SMI1/KNR4 family protein [Streptococcus parasanguinis]